MDKPIREGFSWINLAYVLYNILLAIAIEIIYSRFRYISSLHIALLYFAI